MRNRNRTLTAIDSKNIIKVKQPNTVFQQDDCKIKKDTKYCIAKQRTKHETPTKNGSKNESTSTELPRFKQTARHKKTII